MILTLHNPKIRASFEKDHLEAHQLLMCGLARGGVQWTYTCGLMCFAASETVLYWMWQAGPTSLVKTYGSLWG